MSTSLVLFEIISEWSGMNLDRLSEKEVEKLTKYQITMIIGGVTSATDHLKDIADRNESEEWAYKLIKATQKNSYPGKEHLGLYTFANPTDVEGELLPLEVASIDLLNIIRPTVALTVRMALMGHVFFKLDGFTMI